MPSKRIDTGKPSKKPSLYKPPLVKKIIEYYEKGHTIARICVAVGISIETYFLWQREKPEFKKLIEEAKVRKHEALGVLAESALERKIAGEFIEEIQTEEGVGAKGKISIVRTTKRYIPPSDTAIIFALKNRRPEEYRDRVEVQKLPDLTPNDLETLKSEIKTLVEENGFH